MHTDHPTFWRIDQGTETPLTTANTRHVEVSHLYARSRDSRLSEIEGQDYLAWQWQNDRIVFVVCDGVGQSFCGQLAAEFLGNELVNWLNTVSVKLGADVLAEQITDFLALLVEAGSDLVRSCKLPEGIPPLLREALETQRSYGSESMFVAGCLDFPPNPLDKGRVLLCWLGDAQVQVLDRDGLPLDIGGHWETKERWSTVHGVKGASQVHTWVGDLDRLGRVIAYSDGLASVTERLPQLVDTPELLQAEVERCYQSPDSDDISLVDVRLQMVAKPSLERIDNRWPDLGCRLVWQADADSPVHILEKSANRDFTAVQQAWVTSVTSRAVSETEMDDAYYRVFAWHHGMHSEASPIIQTSVRPIAADLRLIIPAFILLLWLLVVVRILIR